MGPVGAGQAAKAVNQIFLAGAYAGLGEALVFAERAACRSTGWSRRCRAAPPTRG